MTQTRGMKVLEETERLHQLVLVADQAYQRAARQAEVVRLLAESGPFERLHTSVATEAGGISYGLNSDQSSFGIGNAFECTLRDVEDLQDLIEIAVRPRAVRVETTA